MTLPLPSTCRVVPARNFDEVGPNTIGRAAKATIRTSDTTPCANLIVVSG